MLLDVDGTLIPSKGTILTSPVKEWVREAKDHFSLYLVSNNPSKNRIGNVSQQLGINFIHRASKPRRNSIVKVINEYSYSAENIAIIGDRLLTDVFVGNRLGLFTVLVRTIGQEGKEYEANRLQRVEKRMAKIIGRFTS